MAKTIQFKDSSTKENVYPNTELDQYKDMLIVLSRSYNHKYKQLDLGINGSTYFYLNGPNRYLEDIIKDLENRIKALENFSTK